MEKDVQVVVLRQWNGRSRHAPLLPAMRIHAKTPTLAATRSLDLLEKAQPQHIAGLHGA
jgi:hypothetical protein